MIVFVVRVGIRLIESRDGQVRERQGRVRQWSVGEDERKGIEQREVERFDGRWMWLGPVRHK